MLELMKQRHSVRSYLPTLLEPEKIQALEAEITACNQEGGLHIQLVTNDDRAFEGLMAHYGKFSGVRNYIALIGKKSPELEEAIGWYGQRLVLKAQSLGLNTCWVAMSFRKGAAKGRCQLAADEKLVCVLALGYGATQGTAHKSKPLEAVCTAEGSMPGWFRAGVAAALLAPTAMNQQKFRFTLENGRVRASAGTGFYTKTDLGIAKYHFTLGAGETHFDWA